MSYSRGREQKPETVSVSVESHGQFRLRDHYCTKRRAVVGLRVDGINAEAERYNCAPTVADWVRVCSRCRWEIAEATFPAIRHELQILADRLATDLREKNGELLALADDARELCEITTGLEAAQARRQELAPTLRRGFVYLIAGGDAVKTEADERGLHERFAKHRIRGEWFRRCEEIDAYFSERSLPL